MDKILLYTRHKNNNYEEIKERLKKDSKGWIYCIESEILNVYGKEYIIIDITKEEEIDKEINRYPKGRLIEKIGLEKVNSYYLILKLIIFKNEVNNKGKPI